MNFKASVGVVLSSGKGCVEKKTGRFCASWVKPGDVVLYDKTIPWQFDLEATDEKLYQIDCCNILDIHYVEFTDD